MDPKLTRVLRSFDALAFTLKHGGHKETPSIHTYEYLLTCPRCASLRLRWNNRKHTFICWGCKLTGDTIFLIQIMEQCDELGAIDYIYDGYVGGDAKIDKLDDLIGSAPAPVVMRARALKPIEWPKSVDLLSVPCAPHGQAWAYLRSRGVSEASVSAWKLGYGRHGRLSGFVIFPCFVDGHLVYWQGRACWDPPDLPSEARKLWVQSTGYRKTLNPTTREGYATAGDVLLGYDRARSLKHIVIVEGPIDAIKVGDGAVALLGKVLTPAKLDRLMRTRAQRFTVYLDRGKEEREAALKMAAELSAFGEVFIATPPEGFDPGSLTYEQNAKVIKEAPRYQPGALTSFLQG